jgi:hypothetical protein
MTEQSPYQLGNTMKQKRRLTPRWRVYAFFARSLGCFVDLLLTWDLASKKPRGWRGVTHCIVWYFWLRG